MEKDQETVYLFDSAMARLERIIKRLWILCIILIIALITTNGAWIYYESSFEDVVVTQEATADGNSDIQLQNIGGDYHGRESETDN